MKAAHEFADQLNGLSVGAHGRVGLCDFCNAPFDNGDDVKALVTLQQRRNSTRAVVTHVVCGDWSHDEQEGSGDLDVVAATISTKWNDPEQYVLADVRPADEV